MFARKNTLSKPRIAKILELNILKGSFVIAKWLVRYPLQNNIHDFNNELKATKGRCGGYMFSFDKKMFSINMV
jgi:uncharacterized protein YacL